jgi:hypothetical protein
VAAPIGTLKDLQEFLEDPETSDIYMWLRRTDYPVYGVLLYPPGNHPYELRHLREYVLYNFTDLFERTGGNWLLVVFENLPYYPVQDFRPDEVYEIARFLGAEATDVPCIIFFTDPDERSETLVVSVSELLASTPDIYELVDKLASIATSCSTVPRSRRLSCLRDGIKEKWPRALRRGDGISEARAPNTLVALTTIVNMFRLS